MASLVLGAAGAFVGSFFGPLGTSIGWAVGSAIGGSLFQKSQQGPRLTDLKMHNSTFGQMIPLLYGTDRIAGNVIWETDLVEHEQKSGGKGGIGGGGVTQYTYTVSFAVLMCAGPILGVKRIWANSRLVFDPVSGLSAENFPFTLYLGTEDQLPDPTMEANEGVGNVNANRGNAYVVFTDFLLTEYGNTIPSLTFEIYTASDSIPWRVSTFTPANNDSHTGFGLPQNGMIEDGVLKLAIIPDWHINSSGSFTFSINSYDFDGNLLDTGVVSAMPYPAGGTTPVTAYRCINNAHICHAIANSAGPSNPNALAFYFDGGLTTAIANPGGDYGDAFAINGVSWFANDAIYCPAGHAGAYIAKWSAPGGVCTNGVPVQAYAMPGTGVLGDGGGWLATGDDKGNIWVMGHRSACQTQGVDQLYKFDPDLTLLHSWAVADMPDETGAGGVVFTVWNGIICVQPTVGGSPTSAATAFSINDDFTFTELGNISQGQPGNIISLGNGYCLVGNGIISLTPRPQGELLSDVVTDLSERSGLDSSQIDVSELTDLVEGYVISTQGQTRGMIEPLQTAYFFDAVESDTQAKFVKRGKFSQASIPDDDLGAYPSGGNPPPLATVARTQEVDLPRIITCVYVNLDSDYQNGTQISQRLITSSQMSVSLQLAIVMDDKKAKSITDGLLYSAWEERDAVTFQLSRKWTMLEPTDVIDGHGYTIRVTNKSETVPGVVTLEGVVTSPYSYTQPQGLGVPGLAPPPQPPPSSSQLTELRVLDLPLVNDADYANGYYAAMAGATTATWPGATLYKSVDGGVNYSSLLADTVPDTIGDATTALASFSGGNIFDETNTVTVQLHAGAGDLESRSELEVLNGANGCVLGSELLQFKNASLIGSKLYTLSGLLRGRRGTEFAIGGHTARDQFAMLPTSTNVNGPFGELFVPRQFKAVTSGGTLAAATAVPFTNNGVALRCYSPCDVGGGLNASGDLIITWLRRTRIGGTWQNFVDVPLSESTEAYVVQIWDATFTTCARVITGITSPTTTYTAAQQVTDFGATQQTIFVTVGQIGTIGLGVQQGAALPGAGGSIGPPLNPVPPYNSGPPSPPPSGGCIGTVFNNTLTWATGVVRTVAPSGFAPGTNWVLKLTTPGSGNFVGALDFYEYGGPPGRKTGVLALGACGAPLIPAVQQDQFYPVFNFALSATPYFPTVFANLEYGTDYYFSLQTYVPGQTAVDLHISTL